MDTQIWYAIYATLHGGFAGVYRHIGEVSSKFIALQYNISNHCNFFHYLWDFLSYPKTKSKIAVLSVTGIENKLR